MSFKHLILDYFPHGSHTDVIYTNFKNVSNRVDYNLFNIEVENIILQKSKIVKIKNYILKPIIYYISGVPWGNRFYLIYL